MNIQHIINLSRLEKAESRIAKYIAGHTEEERRIRIEDNMDILMACRKTVFDGYLSKFVGYGEMEEAREEALVGTLEYIKAGYGVKESIHRGLLCASRLMRKESVNNVQYLDN